MSSRRALAAAAGGALALTGSGTAWALWTAAGSGTATATGDVVPKAATPAIGAVSGSTVPLSFATVSTSGGTQVTSYDVTRTRTSASGTATGLLAASACSLAGSTVSCTDSAAPGTYTYSVVGRVGLWVGAASSASAVATVVAPDTTAPLVSVTSPFAGQVLTTGTPTYSGDAGTLAGDLAPVTVRVYAGTAATGTPLQTATVTSVAGSWTWTPTTALVTGSYVVTASQSDSAGNTGMSSANAFTVSLPTGLLLDITDPLEGASVTSLSPVFRGTSTLGTTVTVKVFTTNASGQPTTTQVGSTTTATPSAGTWAATYPSTLTTGTLYAVTATQVGAVAVTHTFVTGIAPAPGSGIVLANTSAVKAGVIDIGDTITENYTVAVRPSTVYGGWSDAPVGTPLSAPNVLVSFSHTGSGANAVDTITGASLGGVPVSIGTISVKAGFLSNSATTGTARATLTLDAAHRAVRLTLTSTPVDASGASIVANGTGSSSQTAVTWTPPYPVTDLAGNHVPSAIVPVVNQLAF